MQISKRQLLSFIELYKKEFNISLSPVEAQENALSLLRFLAISVIPIDLNTDSDKITMPDLSL